MLSYLFALLGLVLLCVGWVLFQLWLERQDPQRGGFRPGCGAWGNKDACDQRGD